VRDDLTLVSNVERLMILRTFAGFADLPPAEVSLIAQHSRRRFFPAGSHIARAGEPIKSIYFVVDGEIELSRHGHPLRTMGPRSTVGALSALASDGDTPRIVATRDTLTLAIQVDDMLDVFEDNFSVMVSVLRSIARTILESRRELGPAAGYVGTTRAPVACPARPLDLVERIFFLRRTIVFASTRIEALAQLARDAREVRVAAGTSLWVEGAPCERLLFVVCGRVRATTAAGQEFFFREGDALGGLDMLAGQAHWYNADVLEDLVALQFDPELFLDVLEDHHEMARDFLQTMAASLLELFERQAGHLADQRSLTA
jgi:CRP-like cAMP-binding protein